MAFWEPIVGAAIGGLLGGSGSSGGSSQTTNNSVPPEFAPLARWGADRARQIGDMPFTPLPFNPTAGFNPYQFSGFDMTANRAMQPNAMLGAGEGLAADTLSGRYLQGNPYVDDMVRQTMDDLQGRFNTTAMGSGSFGNANATQAGMRGMADAANSLRYGNYNAERGRQMDTLQMMPQTYMAGFLPAQQMLGIGGTMQQQGQNQLNSMMQEFQRAQQWPFQTFQTAMTPFSQNIGSQQSTSAGQLCKWPAWWCADGRSNGPNLRRQWRREQLVLRIRSES